MVKRKIFPTFWVIVLVFALAWLFSDLGYLNINIPWLPITVVLIAIGAIVNHYG